MGRPNEAMNTLVIHKKDISADDTRDKTPKHIAMWDAVGICPQNDDCPLHLDCPYLPKIIERANVAKCAIQEHYVKYMYHNLVEANIYDLDQAQLDQIGFLLIPMYAHLIKFKMVEYALNLSTEVVSVSKMGVKNVHPIYREIRETIKHISMMSEQCGINKAKSKSYFKNIEIPDFINGDGSMATDDMDDTTMKPLNYRGQRVNKHVEQNRKDLQRHRSRGKIKVKTVNM